MNMRRWRDELKRVDDEWEEIYGGKPHGEDYAELLEIVELEEFAEQGWNRARTAEQSGINIDKQTRGKIRKKQN